MFYKIKIDKADKIFSEYIRLRDKHCLRCGKLGEGTKNINGLQCSHFYSRRNESVRFDEENADTLCVGCHHEWGTIDRESYREFKLKQLGQKKFDLLLIRARTYQKRDRALAHLYWKQRLKEMA